MMRIAILGAGLVSAVAFSACAEKLTDAVVCSWMKGEYFGS